MACRLRANCIACTPVAHRLHAGRTEVAIRQQVGKWEGGSIGRQGEAMVATYVRDGRSQFDIPAHHESEIIGIENALEKTLAKHRLI
ncbi:hypothetical protein CVU37_04930 [candidate division BRC1 bacterium HGW-BRC1-1]|jgi:hypothetical protein|nr:MAG: hypothetical protein CVU37_04930 [candidate division BRC1 bacterium HGW-BRC1-1]